MDLQVYGFRIAGFSKVSALMLYGQSKFFVMPGPCPDFFCVEQIKCFTL